MTFMFLIVILGATDERAPSGFAPIAIGLGLTLIHLISIPVTNTSVNPARSTGPALFVGGWALQQLWLFWVAPIVGAALRRRGLSLDQRRAQQGRGDRGAGRLEQARQVGLAGAARRSGAAVAATIDAQGPDPWTTSSSAAPASTSRASASAA